VHRLVRALLESGAEPHGGAILSTEKQPWQSDPFKETKGKYRDSDSSSQNDGGRRREHGESGWEPIPDAELAAIAAESSQAERRADDAERELMEWKKMRFMEDRVGDDFSGIILSCTKYGFFVELDELFIEGLVPIASLSGWGSDERYVFRDTDRQIVSTRSGRTYKMGQRVHVLLDRIDRQQRRLQFALVPDAVLPVTGSRKEKQAKRAKGALVESGGGPAAIGRPKKDKAQRGEKKGKRGRR
jgi:ribonuclease R